MRRRRILLLFSITLNIVFIFIFVNNLQKPLIKELTDDNRFSNTPESLSNPTPEVIGLADGSEDNLIKVKKVIDGDTITLESGETLRYIGIDTPEKSGKVECFSEQSTLENRELVLGKMVRLEKDVSEVDRYGRLLRYVYLQEDAGSEIFVNEYLVRNGYASAATYPPDVKHSELFREAEREARDKNLGLWSSCKDETGSGVNTQTGNNQLVSQMLGSVNCSGNSYNCSDFQSQNEAQMVFETCGGSTNDIHKLDSDRDGKVCESLP